MHALFVRHGALEVGFQDVAAVEFGPLGQGRIAGRKRRNSIRTNLI